MWYSPAVMRFVFLAVQSVLAFQPGGFGYGGGGGGGYCGGGYCGGGGGGYHNYGGGRSYHGGSGGSNGNCGAGALTAIIVIFVSFVVFLIIVVVVNSPTKDGKNSESDEALELSLQENGYQISLPVEDVQVASLPALKELLAGSEFKGGYAERGVFGISEIQFLQFSTLCLVRMYGRASYRHPVGGV